MVLLVCRGKSNSAVEAGPTSAGKASAAYVDTDANYSQTVLTADFNAIGHWLVGMS